LRRFTEKQTAGILGNFQEESLFSPTNAESISGRENLDYEYKVNDGVGWGIAQWTFKSRKQGLLDYAIEKDTAVGDMVTQLEFIQKELTENREYRGMLDKIKQSDNIDEVTEIFMMRYENPEDKSRAALDKRIEHAKNVYNELGGGQ
jgi:hypothetical protein